MFTEYSLKANKEGIPVSKHLSLFKVVNLSWMETYGFDIVHISNIFSKRFRKLFLGRAFPVIMKTDLVHVEYLENIFGFGNYLVSKLPCL